MLMFEFPRFIAKEPSQLELANDLLEAALSGDIEKASDCIARGADVNAEDSAKINLLMCICYYWMVVSSEQRPPDAFARLVTLFVNAGVDLTAIDHNGYTVMHWAVLCRRKDFIVPLLKAGAKLEAANNEGNTPLHLACIHSNKDAIRDLLVCGANKNAVNKEGVTPKEILANNSFKFRGIIQEANLDLGLKLEFFYSLLKTTIRQNPNVLKDMLHYLLYGIDIRSQIAGPSKLPFEDDVVKCRTVLQLYRDNDMQTPLSSELTKTQLYHFKSVAPSHLKLSQLCALKISKEDWFTKVPGAMRSSVMAREDDRLISDLASRKRTVRGEQEPDDSHKQPRCR